MAPIRVGKREFLHSSLASFDPDDIGERQFSRAIVPILVLLIIVSSLSLASVAKYYDYLGFFVFDGSRLLRAIPGILPIASLAFVFAVGRPSLGYFLGLNFYNLIFGYMWLVPISTLGYDHLAAMISALLSAIAFLLPAVFICRPAPRIAALSAAVHDRLLDLILIVGVAIVAVGAFYNFRIVGLAQMYEFRKASNFLRCFDMPST